MMIHISFADEAQKPDVVKLIALKGLGHVVLPKDLVMTPCSSKEECMITESFRAIEVES